MYPVLRPAPFVETAGAGNSVLCLDETLMLMSSVCRYLNEITGLSLKLCEIAVFFVVALGRAFDKLEKMPQIFALGGFEFGKFDAHAEGWTALGNNAGEDEALDPNLAVSQPKTDFYSDSGRHRRCGLDEASPDTGIRQVSPDRHRRIT